MAIIMWLSGALWNREVWLKSREIYDSTQPGFNQSHSFIWVIHKSFTLLSLIFQTLYRALQKCDWFEVWKCVILMAFTLLTKNNTCDHTLIFAWARFLITHLQVLLIFHCDGHDKSPTMGQYRGIHAGVIVYIFAHLYTALLTEINMLDTNWLQAAKELAKLNTCWNS